MMASVTGFILSKRIFFNLLSVLLVILGVRAYLRTPVDVYPDVPFNEAVVTTEWPGATSKEVELLVTEKTEQQIMSVKDIVKIRSHSSRGRSVINIKFDEGLTDQQFQNRMQDLRDAVSRVDGLPPEVEQPEVEGLTSWDLFPLCKVVISGGTPGSTFTAEQQFLARQVARDLAPRIRDLDGVERVDLSSLEPQIHIQARNEDLWRLGYTLDDVARRLEALNHDFAAGHLDSGTGRLLLNTKGGSDDFETLEQLVLFEQEGDSAVRVGDLARVSLGHEEAVVLERFNRKPALSLFVVKQPDAHAVELVRAVRRLVATYQDQNPRLAEEGTQIAVVNDNSQVMRSRLAVLHTNLAGGVVLVGVTLWVILGARNALLALMGIPFSLLCAFILFEPLGMTVNAISLFSLVLVSGMVVDDAIIVLESIYQKIETGLRTSEAILRGVVDVAGPVFSATLTTVCAFLPLLLTEGTMGKYFAVVPKTVAVVLAVSLMECFVFLPIHYHHWGRRAEGARGREEWACLSMVCGAGVWGGCPFD